MNSESKDKTKTYQESDVETKSDADRPILDPRIGRLPERLEMIMQGESARSFARKAGVAEGTLRNILGGGIPKIDNLLRIASAANVDLMWLYLGETSKSEAEPSKGPEMSSQLIKYRLSYIEDFLGRLETPLTPEMLNKDQQLIEFKQELRQIASNPNATTNQVNRANSLAAIAFGDDAASNDLQQTKAQIYDTYSKQVTEFNQAVDAVGLQLPPILKERLKNAVINHKLPMTELFGILEAIRDNK